MTQSWQDIIELVPRILEYFSSEKRFVQGECNCDRCVAERIEKIINPEFVAIKKYFPDTLKLWQLDDALLLKLYKFYGGDVDRVSHGTRSEQQLGIIDQVARENIRREKKVPINKKLSCGCCGVILNKDKCFFYQEQPICVKCAKIYNQCTICKSFCTKNEIKKVRIIDCNNNDHVHVEEVCFTCLNEKYTSCRYCGNFHLKEYSIKVLLGEDLQEMCLTCKKKCVRNCDDCGITIHVKQGYSETRNKIYCRDCYAYHKPINNYDFRPKHPVFCCDNDETTDKTKVCSVLFFGVELEIEQLPNCQINNQDMAIKMRELWPKRHLYAVRDGSLVSGFELVTQPFTWKRFTNSKKLWMEMFKQIAEYGFGTGLRAGQHVHLSKGAFTTLHLYKFIQFLYKKNSRKFLAMISERPLTGDYARQYFRFDTVDINNSKKVAKCKNNLCDDKHHAAINLSNADTVEIRVFKTPSTFENFAKNMEFMYALYLFSRDHSMKDMVISKFIEYVKANEAKFYNLFTFINKNWS